MITGKQASRAIFNTGLGLLAFVVGNAHGNEVLGIALALLFVGTALSFQTSQDV